ncbi:glycoside hydrolase family 47 protein [Sporobolomyces salmoneus]|uniref:glycoside hydrolase family 47 protein n=1 Tax=Sporobolomyces salmoneus TaxID=183962 RepID=UPI00317BB9A0
MGDLGGGRAFSSSTRHHHHQTSTSDYSRIPTNDSTANLLPSTRSTDHPYNCDYEAGVNGHGQFGRVNLNAEGDSSNGSFTGALTAATRLRGTRQKLLWLTAAVCLVYLVHVIRSPEDDGHLWHPHPFTSPSSSFSDSDASLQAGDLDIYEPPSSPPSSHNAPDKEATLDPSLIDVSAFVQPRRKIRPSSPDPWEDVPHFAGKEWLSPERFGDDESGWKGMKDPPKREGYNSPPPAKWLLKAFEFAVKVMEKDWKGMNMGKGAEWDKNTGRVKMVERKWMKWVGRQGWSLPMGEKYKVSEVGSNGRKMKRVQVSDEDVERREGREEFESREKERRERRDWVKRAFLHAWEGYKEHAWGHDELAPVSNLWSDRYNGWGATLVDNLDTLLIMNLSHEYNLARQHVSQIDFTYLVPASSRFFSTDHLPPLSSLDVTPDPNIDYDNLPNSEGESESAPNKWISQRLQSSLSPFSPTTIPLFETTIRYLGGLISAYDLSGGDPLMLARAKELGDWLLLSLNTDWGLAVPRYKMGFNPDGGPSGRAVLAEVGSLGMELIRLSMITGDETYYIAAQRAMDTLETRFTSAAPVSSSGGKIRGRLGSLLPSHINPGQPGMVQGEYTFGGLADSYYEYLIKQAQLTRFSNPQFSRMYSEAIDSAYEYLIRPVESIPGREHDLVTIGAMNWGSYRHELQHLTCFAGGMLGLGARLMDRPRDLETAKNFTEACVWVYESSTTGIGGEQTTFYDKDDVSRFVAVNKPDGTTIQQPRGDPMGVRTANRKQIGRPETIESVFYMWRLTGDRYWQDRGWQMFTSWVEHSITESGFATVGDVNTVPVRKDDSMESFVTAETLKYYYLLFSPRDYFSLDDFVFNTEAHPFLIPKPPSSIRPSPLWTGPEPALEEETNGGGFVSQMGEGTWVQKWARVIQASRLAESYRNEPQKAGWFGGGGGGFGAKEKEETVQAEKPVKFRKPIRPSEEELEQARKAMGEGNRAAGAGGGAEGFKEEAWMAAGGGGKGMGGGGPPPSD